MSGFERKLDSQGNINPKYIDLCDEDQPLPGQKFACMSFVSPEKILKKREVFLFNQFVKQFDFNKSMEKFTDLINFFAYKYKLDADTMLKDFKEFVSEENELIKKYGIEDDYKNFMDKHEDKLNEDFNREHSFQTSVRGLKIRGVYNTQEEAEERCKSLRKVDVNHDIFVGPVGMWIPWDPDAYKTGRVEFLEEELNELHKQKMENEAKAKNEFDTRVKDAKRKAIEDNIKKATDSGNTLTQTIDENNNLIGVPENVNFDERDATTVDETNEHNRKILENALKNNN
tara:strand:+ start:1321 stop:2178 length:858 start_codon:yes stop_codon:yes gene_type:complete